MKNLRRKSTKISVCEEKVNLYLFQQTPVR